jgi:hypothetical protein
MKKLLFFPLFIQVFLLQAQEISWKNIDFVYQDHIRTVSLLPEQTILATNTTGGRLKSQTSVSGQGLKMDSLRQKNQIADIPIFALSNGRMLLSFDDLEGEFKYYRFKIVYCNSDWSLSSLNELEYIKGYAEDRLPDGRQSFGMTSNYTNYRLTLPNENTRFTKSGNYLLHIYLDSGGETMPILTRRFCIFENLLTLQGKFTPTGKTEKTNTHHELDITATYKNLSVRNPQREIKLTVLQNSQWATAKQNIPPSFHSLGSLVFDYQDSIVFPAGREFRPFDLRSLVFNRIGVSHISSFEDSYDVTLFPDRSRENVPYRFYFDVNGGFVIDNIDLLDNTEPEIRSEYPNVAFTLFRNEPYQGDVYVIGKMTDWQPYEAFKMTYNENKKQYILDVPIKQGYYDYTYALVNKGGVIVDINEIDGNWYETENNYNILLYYRAIGERFDRLIGYHRMNSLTDR